MKWNTETYDQFHSFVSSYGASLISWLEPKPAEQILDLGCGTGDLTKAIADSGARVIGIDASQEMIDAAQRKHPQLKFKVADAKQFQMDNLQDAVFSNAALHWIRPPEQVVECVAAALKPGGRFVAEFGMKGNVQSITDAVIELSDQKLGIDLASSFPWYFPPIGEYIILLEKYGFHIRLAESIHRPTPLAEAEQGLAIWLDQFAGGWLSSLTPEQRSLLYTAIEQQLAPLFFKEGRWVIHYQRLRFIAYRA
ncbi:class I SAM-dependent methyltransferase [Marinicrinis lubricantis]|uniref:Class I SAM-dependent methyltransferase n=1 Tax=Marinicrinis lubricantis TaxID=2086470 RepID=A0ABW1ITA7_9BACL